MYYFFYVPIGTELPVRRFPFAVVSLVAMNLGYFLLFQYSPAHAGKIGALALDTAHPTLLKAFTACFLHGSWMHLIGNMVFLVTFGPALESRITGARFLLLYLASGIGGMLIQVEANALAAFGHTPPFVLGASGAVAGVLGLFAVRCGFARVRVAHVTMALVQGQSRFGTVRLNGVAAVAGWILLQVVYALTAQAAGGGSIAFASHFGGVSLGILMALLFGLHRDAAVECIWIRSRRHMDERNWFAALGETTTYLERVPEDVDAWLQVARLNRILDRPEDSSRAFRKALDLLWSSGDGDRAVAVLREIRRHYPETRIRPALLFRLADTMRRGGDLGWASHAFQDYARLYPGHERAPGALLRSAEIESRYRNDLNRAGGLYRELVDRWPDGAEGREASRRLEAIERILAGSGICGAAPAGQN